MSGKGLYNVYDAFGIAKELGYSDTREQGLSKHRNVCLVWGGIYSDEKRMLAIMPGLGQPIDTTIRMPGLQVRVFLPEEYVHSVGCNNVGQDMMEQLYERMELWDIRLLKSLLCAMTGTVFVRV